MGVKANARVAVPTAHGADEVEGGQSRAVFAAIALPFSFLVHIVSGGVKGIREEDPRG